VNETVTVQTEASVQQPTQHNWKRDLAHSLGMEDEFFMKRDLEELDLEERDFEDFDLEERDFEDFDLEERDFEEDDFMY